MRECFGTDHPPGAANPKRAECVAKKPMGKTNEDAHPVPE